MTTNYYVNVKIFNCDRLLLKNNVIEEWFFHLKNRGPQRYNCYEIEWEGDLDFGHALSEMEFVENTFQFLHKVMCHTFSNKKNIMKIPAIILI